LVIRYSYLWASQYAQGQEEGVKDRPCAIVLATADDADGQVVTVLPISHTPPTDPLFAVELPAAVKRRLKLDDERSWVILAEANRFTWPGPDLRPLRPGDAQSAAYGPLPYGLFEEIRLKFIATLKSQAVRAVPRSE